MTKKEMFEQLAIIVTAAETENKAELLSGIRHEIDLLNRKASAPKKPTAVQVQNEALKERLINEVLTDTPKTVSDILTELNDNTLTNQRVTHLLTALVAESKAVRDVVKRKAFYTIAG